MANSTVKNSKCNKNCTKSKTVAASAGGRSREISIPENYEPISMWGYFGYEILFDIPLVGWILCVSFALMAHNHNLRNFARSKFCLLIIWIILFCVLAGVGVLGAIVHGLGMN